MEGGRQAEIAKSILSAKNVPYMVAAPLLIQVMGTPCNPSQHVAGCIFRASQGKRSTYRLDTAAEAAAA